MNVGIFVAIEVIDAINHCIRFLRGCAVIQPDQGTSVNLLLQYGEVALNHVRIKRPFRETDIRNQFRAKFE